MYNKKRRGPNILPLGTPHFVTSIAVNVPLISVHCYNVVTLFYSSKNIYS